MKVRKTTTTMSTIKLTFAILAMIALGASSAWSATTGNITIQGSVAANTAIVVNSITGFNNLDLSTTQSDLKVAEVQELNNTTAGYSVTLTSANSGALKNGTLGSITYTATYNGASVTLSSSAQTITTQGAQTAIVDSTKDFDISYTGQAVSALMEGTYSDTLTFTIIAN